MSLADQAYYAIRERMDISLAHVDWLGLEIAEIECHGTLASLPVSLGTLTPPRVAPAIGTF